MLFGWCLSGKKKKKIKKIHELQLRFSYRLFGMPAKRTSFGALADITVTTSYRGRTLVFRQTLVVKIKKTPIILMPKKNLNPR